MSEITEIKKEDWLTDLVTKIKLIQQSLKYNSFKSAREIGKLILESGYEKGKWNKNQIKTFCDLTGYGKSTIYKIIEIGRLSDVEFSTDVESCNSLSAWMHQPKMLALRTKIKVKKLSPIEELSLIEQNELLLQLKQMNNQVSAISTKYPIIQPKFKPLANKLCQMIIEVSDCINNQVETSLILPEEVAILCR